VSSASTSDATGGAVDNFQIALSVGGEAVDVGFSVAGLGQVQVGRGGDISVGQGELQDFFQLDISSDGYSAGVALNIGGLNAAQAQQVAAAFEQATSAPSAVGTALNTGSHYTGNYGGVSVIVQEVTGYQ
jgi:hypothetical protein